MHCTSIWADSLLVLDFGSYTFSIVSLASTSRVMVFPKRVFTKICIFAFSGMVGSARKALLDVFLDRVTCPMTGSSFELKLHADHYKALASKRADAGELCCFFSALTDYIYFLRVQSGSCLVGVAYLTIPRDKKLNSIKIECYGVETVVKFCSQKVLVSKIIVIPEGGASYS